MSYGRVVDLTQPLGEDTVVWPGQGRVRAETVSKIDSGGFYTRRVQMSEHTGTHLDAPAHFDPGGRGTDRIPASSLVAPCVVLDVSGRCEKDPDFALDAAAIEELERRDGRIEEGAAVLVATGWEHRRGDADRYLGGRDKARLSFPGVGVTGAELLVERGVVGLGIDTASVDVGRATAFSVHHVTLPAGL